MLNEIKKVLLKPYNEQLDEYSSYKEKFDELQDKIVSEHSEQEYAEQKKELKNEYKTSKDKEAYNKHLEQIMKEYKKKLDLFSENLETYNTMKSRLASWNVYEIKRQMEKINKANTLEELNLTIDQAREICNENGIEFRVDLDQM